ncbi:uncharacterized protein [Haliotis cracherodii]|uniref:uncharacterized protein n=1 Tax=Haliotis cracherodii TaxID=6455 RepID=UPI0039E8E75D
MFTLLLTVAMLMPLGTRSIRFSGTEFILAFCEHRNHRSAPVLTIINDNDDLITVNISTPRARDVIPLTTKVVKDFLTFALPEEASQLFTSKHSLGIHVTSDQEIYVQGFNTASNSIGAFLALPVSQLGTEYTVVTLCESNVCLFMIVATEDDTDVTVNFQIAQGKVNFNNVNYQSEDTLEITLQTYDTLQLQCSVDLSGTYVTATKPVAVYSGSDYTEVDYYQHYDGKDNIVEQMPPITALGSMYVLPPFPDLPDTYQIKAVSISDNNSINRPWEKHVADGAEGFTICNSTFWRLYLLQRGFSVRVLFDRVHWFVSQCCVPTLL